MLADVCIDETSCIQAKRVNDRARARTSQPTNNLNNADYEYDEVYEMIEGTNRRGNETIRTYYVEN